MAEDTYREIRIDSIQLSENPEDYYVQDGLLKALEIAIALGRPLLLSGEPGTGKTRLAHWAAQQLERQTKGKSAAFLRTPFEYIVKSGSQASDLFYHYDAVSHFRMQGEGSAEQFIELKALGLAIAQSLGRGTETTAALRGIRNLESGVLPEARSSVMLIDEIDKAPREFPNDLLHELERTSFEIPELNRKVDRPKEAPGKIVVIITSNSEKNLPNAFLRRCVFYHINFPEKKLLAIAKLKLNIDSPEYDEAINAAIDEFMNMRSTASNKKPTTSEFLDWLGVLRNYKLLEPGEFPPKDADKLVQYKATKVTIFKTTDDLPEQA